MNKDVSGAAEEGDLEKLKNILAKVTENIINGFLMCSLVN